MFNTYMDSILNENLFPQTQPLVDNRYIVIVLCLIEVPIQRFSQVVLLRKFLHREVAPVPIGVAVSRFIKVQFTRLFVDKESVAVETTALRWG